ncbi:hypothetical protein K438DRAFT_1965451 [Mycena galopus ATCC 62051]|nr:hypothetical protein K438DRAFT_1965451 [Mycena galopus ATCC 62051]
MDQLDPGCLYFFHPTLDLSAYHPVHIPRTRRPDAERIEREGPSASVLSTVQRAVAPYRSSLQCRFHHMHLTNLVIWGAIPVLCKSTSRRGCDLQPQVTPLSVLGARFRAPQLGSCAAVAVAILHLRLGALTVEALALRFPGLPSTQEHPTRPTPCLRTGARRAAPPLWSGTRDVPLWRSYPHLYHAAPPTAFLSPLSPRPAGARRAPPAATTSGTACRRGPSTASPHRMRYPTRLRTCCTLRDAVLGPRRLRRVSTLCDRLDQCIAPPVDARAHHALQYYPQHVPRPHRAPRPFLIAGAAFVTFSYATTIIVRSTRAAGRISNMTPMTPTPAAAAHAAFVASPHVLAILSAFTTLRSKPDPGTHHEHDAHAMHVAYPCAATVFSRPFHRLLKPRCEYEAQKRMQHALQLFPIPRTFVPSPRAPTICGVDLPSPLSNFSSCLA